MKYVSVIKFDLYLLNRLSEKGVKYEDFVALIERENPEVANLCKIAKHYNRCVMSEISKAEDGGDYEAIGRLMDEAKVHSIRAERSFRRAVAAMLHEVA